jgi:hypothetical protein
MRARRLVLAAIALASMLAVAAPSHAADRAVTVVAFQFTPSGWVAPAPFVGGTAQQIPGQVPSFTKGDRLVFTSQDPGIPHQVFQISGPSAFPALATMGSVGGLPGGTSTLQTGALNKGLYVYGCSFHGGMRGAFNLV